MGCICICIRCCCCDCCCILISFNLLRAHYFRFVISCTVFSPHQYIQRSRDTEATHQINTQIIHL
ncbi:hypothetical protein AAHE18_19G134900 [Arachis hypogaea]